MSAVISMISNNLIISPDTLTALQIRGVLKCSDHEQVKSL